MPSDSASTPLFDLGTWVGRRQAFGLIANKCSAADAACLKQLRDSKTYRQTRLSWEEFCPRHLGISRPHADRIIQQLEECGEAYFELSQFVRLPEQAYRAIVGAVVGHAIEYDGERIPITPENGRRIGEVVLALRMRAERLKREIWPNELRRLRARLDLWLSQLVNSGGDPSRLLELVDYGIERLAELSRTFR